MIMVNSKRFIHTAYKTSDIVVLVEVWYFLIPIATPIVPSLPSIRSFVNESRYVRSIQFPVVSLRSPK